jgi:hypothetical protein
VASDDDGPIRADSWRIRSPSFRVYGTPMHPNFTCSAMWISSRSCRIVERLLRNEWCTQKNRMFSQTSEFQSKPLANASTSNLEIPKSQQQSRASTKSLNRDYRSRRTEEDEAKLITAKLKRLQGLEKDRFFDAVCQMGRANPFHFNTMISSKTNPGDGADLLQRMQRMTIAPDVVTYTSLIDMEVHSKFSMGLWRRNSLKLIRLSTERSRGRRRAIRR